MKKHTSLWRRFSLLAGIVTLCLAGSACAYREEIRTNRANLAKIRKGMTRKQVIAIMGKPVTGESYCTDKVLFYYTRQEWMDGLITRDECTPIRFDETDRVIGWGKQYNTGIYNTDKVTIRMRNKR